MKTIGIIGTGHLIRHTLPAMVKTGYRFIVSERGRETSSWLAGHYGVEVSSSNQAIVNEADIVIIAVRPFHAVEVCKALQFRPRQTVLSFCASLGAEVLAPHTSPAHLVSAMPVVAAEFGESPTLMMPEDAACRTLLETCGPVLTLHRQEDFAPAATIACYYGWVQELIGEMADWVSAHGVDPETARLLTAQMTRASATSVLQRPHDSVRELVDELATERSNTLKGLEVLRAADAFTPWKMAVDAVRKNR